MKRGRIVILILLVLLVNINQYQGNKLLGSGNKEVNEENSIGDRKLPILASDDIYPKIVEEENLTEEEELRKNVENTLKGFVGGFLENNGQKNEAIYYYTESPQIAVGFGESEIRFNIINPIEDTLESDDPLEELLIEKKVTYTTIALEFLGSNEVIPVTQEPTGRFSNFFVGSDEIKWVVSSQYYTKIVYYNIYEKIDLVYMLKDGQLKYEFYVHPGGDVNEIKLNWIGPVSLDLVNEGIRVTVNPIDNMGNEFSFVDTTPINYQSEERKKPIKGSFELLGVSTYGFSIPTYDPTRLLIIDPTLSYSTYVSGGDDDYGYDIAIDGSGNAFVTGYTQSTDFPTVSAYNDTGDGSTTYTDVFVFKLNSTGNGLEYSTYVSGSDYDYGYGIAIDGAGNAYVTGWTRSNDFPTKNAYDATGDGSTSNPDAFVFKLNSTGNGLVYSTYLSGGYYDYGYGIAIDGAGNAYVTGNTRSTSFPTVNAYDATGDGSTIFSDVFVCKFNSTGNGLVYSTYVSGTNHDEGYGIAIDDAGNAYVTGYTRSTNFPTKNAYDATGDGSANKDVFVCKLNSTGNDLEYSTYVSGSNNDQANGIAIDGLGNAYVTGDTASTDFPTKNAYNGTGDGTIYSDVFVFKLNSNGNDLVYSTYVSGTDNDYGLGIAIDGSDNAYVTGYTSSTDFPTVNAYNDTGDGSTSNYDVFVFKLNSTGNGLVYSTYVSGGKNDIGRGIAIDGAGNAYVTGETTSPDFPTVSAYDDTGGGGELSDVFVFKLIDNPIYIDDNSDFGPSGYNFPGYGNISHPYRIEGYSIINSTTNLIHIQGTTAHFIIRNCQLNGVIGNNYGIYLWNVKNGTITNNTIRNVRYGIELFVSTDNLIENNTISSISTYGIEVNQASFNIIFNNTINDSLIGIRIFASNNNVVINNTIYNISQRGIYLQSGTNYNNVSFNTLFSITGDGIDSAYSGNYNAFSGNTIYNSSWGIYLYQSNFTTIADNILFNNTIGISVGNDCNNNTIQSNTIFNNSEDGIRFFIFSSGSFIENNTIKSNAISTNTLYGINLVDNIYGIYLVNNTFEWNFFFGNYPSFPQASDSV